MMKKVYLPNFLSKSLSILLIFLLVFVILSVKIPGVKAASTYTQTLKSGLESFPESYKKLLEKFVQDTGHDNWNFQAYYTGIDWNDLVSAEGACGKNRIYESFDTINRAACGSVSAGYYCANPSTTAYFLDPRNFINERNMFQFLEISYNEQLYTKDIIAEMVKNYRVFNYGQPIKFNLNGQETEMTFTDIVMEAAKQSQMSPISIVSKILQEVGSNGSASTYGTHSVYPGYYNYFNIGAYDSTDPIGDGLKYAKDHGWNSPYTSIIEGAKYNSKNYIQEGQNTLYFYKFDVVGDNILKLNETATVSTSSLYSHQYMTNVYDPYSQSAIYFNTYNDYNLSNKALNFIIPVYENMPNVVIKPSSLVSNTNVDLYYANISSACNTRTQPTTTSSNVPGVGTLYKDDFVIMLTRKYANVSGMDWDKVQFWNGQIGYVASQFLEKYEPQTNTGQEPNAPTETVIGYGYANVSTTLNVRSGPGTGYNVLGALGAKEEFSILSETTGWTKIKTNTGVVGYISNEYVVKIIKDNTGGQEEIAKIENKVIKVLPETTAESLKEFLNLDSYTVKNGNNIITDGKLSTGYKFISAGNEYTIQKIGDVNGDGKVNTGDAFLIQKHAIKLTALVNDYLTCGDVNKDGKVNTGDAFLIQKYVIKTGKINL